jgi:hypothetical protein
MPSLTKKNHQQHWIANVGQSSFYIINDCWVQSIM